MAITSLDSMITAMSAGQTYRYDWQKTTGAAAYTANRWYETMSLAGLPIATTYPGTAKTWVTCNEAAGDGTSILGIPNGGNVSASIKHLATLAACSGVATAVPGTLLLVDLQGYWNGIDMNTLASQSLSGSPSLRYANGAGLRMFLSARATTGSTAHNLSYSYTNQAGTAGRVNPVTVACTASAIVPHILHSGSAANNYGPFLPMASGDTGIKNVASVQLSAASGTASTAVLCLVRPLASIVIGVAGLQTDKDLFNQFPSLPVIPDGACLGWLYFTGAACAGSTPIFGATEYVWG